MKSGVFNFLIFLPGVWAADVTNEALVAIWNYDVSLKMEHKPRGEKPVWRAGGHGAALPSCTAQPQNLFFFAVTLVMGFLLYEHDSRCLQGNFHFSFAIPGNGSVTVSVFLCQLYEKLTLASFITHGRTQYISLEQKLCQPPYKLFLYIF